MDRIRWTRVLVEGERQLLREMSDEVLRSGPVPAIEGPRVALALIEARDTAAQARFFAGEALLTECVVEVDGVRGFGAVLGEDPERAYRLAVVDAGLAAGRLEMEIWGARLADGEQAVADRHENEARRTAKTRVAFETHRDFGGREDDA